MFRVGTLGPKSVERAGVPASVQYHEVNCESYASNGVLACFNFPISIRHEFVDSSLTQEDRNRWRILAGLDFGPWMGLLIGVPQACRTKMRIDLRRDEAFVSEQFLNAANIGPPIQQVRGKTVTQRVR